MSCTAYLLAGTILLFFTDLVARVARVGRYEERPQAISYQAILEIGIILVALKELIGLIPQIYNATVSMSSTIFLTPSRTDLLRWPFLEAVALVALMFWARPVAERLYRPNNSPPPPI